MLDERTPEQIKRDILARLDTAMETREGSFAQDIIGAVAQEMWADKQARQGMEAMFYVDENSGPYIDRAAAAYGITRKPGAKARALLHFTGTDGTVVPAGKVFLAGTLEFVMVEAVTLAAGAGQGWAEAAAVGAGYNVAAGAIGAQYENLSGLTGVRSDAAAGGIDAESDKALVDRYYDHLRNPATSGNKAHYRQWAKETPGVGDADVIPQMEGPGTVGVIVVDQEMQPVEEAVVQACGQHIEAVRPVGTGAVTVRSAQGLAIHVSAAVRMEASTTIETVQTAFAGALAAYLRQAAFVKRELLYNRIAFMLLDCPGVIDYTELVVNGGTANIAVGVHQVPVLGEIQVTACS